MRLATVFDKDANEARPVFELPGGQRVALRELFRSASTSAQAPGHLDLTEMPMYFASLVKTVEYLDDVIDAVRQWSRHRADQPADQSAASPIDAMPFLPPIPAPRSFREFDAFEQHARTWRARFSVTLSKHWYEAPSFSFANAGALIGHESPVTAPAKSHELDFGLQIAAIIGRGGRDIPAAHAWKHIAGFTIVNSFCARDIERRELDLSIGRSKSRDFATAVGPYLVSLSSLRDRIDADDGLHLAMRAMVNGNELSRADAADMFFTWPVIIEHASRNAPLFPGDLISGGTVPTGSILDLGGASAAPWLKAGDVIELEVERLGILRTPVIDRPSREGAGPSQTTVPTDRTALTV